MRHGDNRATGDQGQQEPQDADHQPYRWWARRHDCQWIFEGRLGRNRFSLAVRLDFARVAAMGEAAEALSLGAITADQLDLLIHETSLRIAGELALPVRHFLITRPGVALADVTIVTSHPQAPGRTGANAGCSWLRAH